MPTFFARYPGDMNDEDRAALQRAGFKLFEDGYSVGAHFPASSPGPEFTTYQVVKLEADDEMDARQRIVDALGREPEDLAVVGAKSG